MTKEERTALRLYAARDQRMHIALGNVVGTVAMDILLAALDYGDAEHISDANCSAGDCDSCSAPGALEKLEELLGGPHRRDNDRNFAPHLLSKKNT